jgi:hypothetical protein
MNRFRTRGSVMVHAVSRRRLAGKRHAILVSVLLAATVCMVLAVAAAAAPRSLQSNTYYINHPATFPAYNVYVGIPDSPNLVVLLINCEPARNAVANAVYFNPVVQLHGSSFRFNGVVTLRRTDAQFHNHDYRGRAQVSGRFRDQRFVGSISLQGATCGSQRYTATYDGTNHLGAVPPGTVVLP